MLFFVVSSPSSSFSSSRSPLTQPPPSLFLASHVHYDSTANVPDIHEFKLMVGDEFLVMACDGLWDVMNSQEVVTCVKDELMQRRSPQQAVQKLFEEAMDRSTVDNVTIVLICFDPTWMPSKKGGLVSRQQLTGKNRVASEVNIRKPHSNLTMSRVQHRGSTIVKGHESTS